MKVYACPIPAPAVDYGNYNRDKMIADEEAHKVQLKRHLQDKGYDGAHTGKVIRFQVADGYAQYMLADGGAASRCALIHLPYGDAYQYIDAKHLPKGEVLARWAQDQAFAKLFAKAS